VIDSFRGKMKKKEKYDEEKKLTRREEEKYAPTKIFRGALYR
jgi:hypothetical protein